MSGSDVQIRQSQAAGGFSLIEILVTIVLIALGVLGMATLQARSVEYSQDAIQRDQAALLADDMVEMMRTDRSNLSAYLKAKNAAVPGLPTSCLPLPSKPGERVACWFEKVKQALPGSADLSATEFYICTLNPSGACQSGIKSNLVEIQMAWSIKQGQCLDGANQKVCRYRVRTQL